MKKVIVISGGSDGLGKTIAKRLSPQNNVIILSRSEEHLKKVSSELNCLYKVCDVSDWNKVEKTIEQIISEHGSIDCLVNSAGLWIEGKLEDNNAEEIKKVMEANTLGTIYLSKAVIPHMKAVGGTIFNIISQAGFYAKAERSVYNTSKWALTGFTKSLEHEIAKDGIRVIGLYPGKMNTSMFLKAGIKKDVSDGLDPQDVAKTIEFVLSLNNSTTFPEIGIKNINN